MPLCHQQDCNNAFSARDILVSHDSLHLTMFIIVRKQLSWACITSYTALALYMRWQLHKAQSKKQIISHISRYVGEM